MWPTQHDADADADRVNPCSPSHSLTSVNLFVTVGVEKAFVGTFVGIKEIVGRGKLLTVTEAGEIASYCADGNTTESNNKSSYRDQQPFRHVAIDGVPSGSHWLV